MIRDAILSQKRDVERALAQKYAKREALLGSMEDGLARVVMGPRRAGKSFFALHALSQLGKFGYANFDDERLAKAKDYDEILGAVSSVYGNQKLLLLDEIQNLPRWELFVNRLQRQGYRMVITGSNSNLLSKELATHLTGRHLQIALLPFSFGETLEFAGGELTRAELSGKLDEYLEKGGYPEIYSRGADPSQHLSTLFDAAIFKDIVSRYKIRNPAVLNELALYLLSNTACEFSSNSLARETRIKSPRTAELYLAYLEEAFLFFSIGRFSYKVGEQVRSHRKAYCVDNGFISAKGFSPSPNRGKLLENAVAIELKKAELSGGCKLFYWKSPQQEEVDFVVRRGLRVEELIQACYDPSGRAKEREIRALLRAGKELSCKNLAVITHEYESEEKASWFGAEGTIRYVPLLKWLLETRKKKA